jgi:hypothetical protein
VHFGAISYQVGDLARFIAGWRDLMWVSDEKLTTALNLTPGVPGQAGSVMMACCYASSDDGEAAAGPRSRCAAWAARPRRPTRPARTGAWRRSSGATTRQRVPAHP